MPTHRGDGKPARAEPGGRQYESYPLSSVRGRRRRLRTGVPFATWEGRVRGRIGAVVRAHRIKGLPRSMQLALGL